MHIYIYLLSYNSESSFYARPSNQCFQESINVVMKWKIKKKKKKTFINKKKVSIRCGNQRYLKISC